MENFSKKILIGCASVTALAALIVLNTIETAMADDSKHKVANVNAHKQQVHKQNGNGLRASNSKASNSQANNPQANNPKANSAKSVNQTAKADATASSSTVSVGAPSGLPDPESIKRGEQVFKNQMCVGCHLNGDNTVLPDKPIKGEAFSQKYRDDTAIMKVVRAGFGGSGMPSYGKDRINDSEMKDLIAYVRSLSTKSNQSK